MNDPIEAPPPDTLREFGQFLFSHGSTPPYCMQTAGGNPPEIWIDENGAIVAAPEA